MDRVPALQREEARQVEAGGLPTVHRPAGRRPERARIRRLALRADGNPRARRRPRPGRRWPASDRAWRVPQHPRRLHDAPPPSQLAPALQPDPLPQRGLGRHVARSARALGPEHEGAGGADRAALQSCDRLQHHRGVVPRLPGPSHLPARRHPQEHRPLLLHGGDHEGARSEVDQLPRAASGRREGGPDLARQAAARRLLACEI